MRCLVLLFAVALVCFAFLPNAGAVTPAPDGGYPSKNTAEGEEALFRLILGSAINNTAIGFHALHKSQTGLGNTATGSEALESNTANYNTATGAFALSSNTTGGHHPIGVQTREAGIDRSAAAEADRSPYATVQKVSDQVALSKPAPQLVTNP